MLGLYCPSVSHEIPDETGKTVVHWRTNTMLYVPEVEFMKKYLPGFHALIFSDFPFFFFLNGTDLTGVQLHACNLRI